MPQKFKIYKVKEVLKALEDLGYMVVGQKGSHIRLKIQTSELTHSVTVPNHTEISIGTLNGIYKEVREKQVDWGRVDELFLNK